MTFYRLKENYDPEESPHLLIDKNLALKIYDFKSIGMILEIYEKTNDKDKILNILDLLLKNPSLFMDNYLLNIIICVCQR